jgi:S-phase kinase-associated protein 1
MPLPKSLKLESSDGEIITVDTETIRQSNTINNMINDLEDQGFSEDDPIPVNNVNGNILNKVIEWCKQHKNDANTPEDDDNDKRTDDIPAWDQEFLKCDQGTLF